MAHPDPVSMAIQKALSDIHLLRFLVRAKTPEAAYAILTAYDPDLTLTEPHIQIFWTSLTRGEITMTAKTLVEYYDNLEPKPRIMKRTSPPQEWNP
jgi:hypothetical protein